MLKDSEEVQESKGNLLGARRVLKAYPDLLVELSAEGEFLGCQEGVEVHLYADPASFLGRDLREVMPAEVVPHMEAALEEVNRGAEKATVNYSLTINGRSRHFECRIYPTEVGTRFSVIRDMTDEWRSLSEMESSEEKYRALVQNMPGAVYRCDLHYDWKAQYVSPMIETITGYPVESFLSGVKSLGSIIHPLERAYVRETVGVAAERGSAYTLNYRMVTASGEIRYIHEQGRPIYGGENGADYLDGVIFDVTEMHRMRQRLMGDQKMAAVGTLAAGVAHEINNPLAIILSNLEYVAEELGAVREAVMGDGVVMGALDDVLSAVESVRSGTDRVRRIIDDLRTFSDAAEGDTTRLDLRRVLRWAVQRFETRRDRAVVVTDLEEVPAIFATEAAVVQVLWNLLENAWEAVQVLPSEEAQVEVVLRPHDELILLEIRDNGEGMTAEVVRRAFDPFYTTRDVGQGAGLGLFVSQGLLEAMEATIELKSEPGEGTTVRVLFTPASDVRDH